MHTAMRALLALTLDLILAAPIARADIPETINYQGRLLDSEGDPVEDNTYTITFSIYTGLTGGTAEWTSGGQAIAVENGLFSYTLNLGPTYSHLFTDYPNLYLGIKVDPDVTEIDPRTKLTSSPYAYHAQVSDGVVPDAITSDEILNGSIASNDLAPNIVMTQHIVDGQVRNGDLDHNAVTTEKIQNGTILLEDLGDNSAAGGDVIKFNGTNWETGGISATPIIWSGGSTTHGRASSWETYGSDGVDFNTAAGYLSTDGSGVFTVQTAGFYRINAWMMWMSSTYWYGQVMKNTTCIHQMQSLGNGGWTVTNMDVTWYFDVADEMSVKCFEGSGTGYGFHSWNSLGQHSRLQITYVGPPAP